MEISRPIIGLVTVKNHFKSPTTALSERVITILSMNVELSIMHKGIHSFIDLTEIISAKV